MTVVLLNSLRICFPFPLCFLGYIEICDGRHTKKCAFPSDIYIYIYIPFLFIEMKEKKSRQDDLELMSKETAKVLQGK